ncbi:unnamed protein product [Parnassius apollo]|uniref:(apollo) hypothetical protein n=1 Tax=Parnassius apollo TaxID=110799 RepID=A0A8S3Y2K5_PARAO|nr:unnamed protein product [Parnassius apollo]
MSDKSGKSESSCSERQTLNKIKSNSGSLTTAKALTKTQHSSKTKLVESTDNCVPKVDAQNVTAGSESEQFRNQPSPTLETEEIFKLSSTPEATTSSPYLEEAIMSSPLPTRSDSSLLRIKTQIRQAKAVEAGETMRRTSEAEDQIDSDNDSGDTNTSLDNSTRSISGSRMFLNELPRHANEILQRSKSELEKPGNLKREIRESVISGLYTLYEMVLKLSDSRMLHMLEANKQKLNVSKESERLTQRHARFMHETLGQYALLKECVDKLQRETESMRMIMSYDLCTAITETKHEVTTVRHEMSSTSCISNQIKTLEEELRLLRKEAESQRHTITKELASTSLTAELQEIRSAINDIKSKWWSLFPGLPTVSTEQEKSQEEQVQGISQELRQEFHQLKTQFQEDITDLRSEISQISQEIAKLRKCPADSLITSVQASVEELRRETRELQDTTVESAAPIRMAIEGLRNEVRSQSIIDRANTEDKNQDNSLQGQRKPEKALTQKQTVVKPYLPPRSYSEVVAKPNFSIMVESADPRNTSDDFIKQL